MELRPRAMTRSKQVLQGQAAGRPEQADERERREPDLGELASEGGSSEDSTPETDRFATVSGPGDSPSSEQSVSDQDLSDQLTAESDLSDQLMHEPNGVTAAQRHRKLSLCFPAFWKYVKEFRSADLAIWVLTWAAFVLFFLALGFDSWRLIAVNREALVLMENEGKIDAALLKEPIAMTRSQSIFHECFVSASTRNESADSRSDSSLKSPCRKLLPDREPEPSTENYRAIASMIEALMSLGSIILFVASLTIVFEALTELKEDLFLTFSMINIGFRTIASVLGVIFLLCSVSLGNQFQEANPGFPASWPPAIRAATQVHVLQAGPIRWSVGTLFHIAALVLSFKRMR